MFNIVIEIAEELRRLNEKRFVPRWYKDMKFKKDTKRCTSAISTALHESVIDYDTIVSLLRFYRHAEDVIRHYNKTSPIMMMNGTDVVSIMYKYGHLKCEMRYNINNDVNITNVYTIPDEENIFIERQHKTYDILKASEIGIYDKMRLIGQIINCINLYMTLIYEYGVKENETDIH